MFPHGKWKSITITLKIKFDLVVVAAVVAVEYRNKIENVEKTRKQKESVAMGDHLRSFKRPHMA